MSILRLFLDVNFIYSERGVGHTQCCGAGPRVRTSG